MRANALIVQMWQNMRLGLAANRVMSAVIHKVKCVMQDYQVRQPVSNPGWRIFYRQQVQNKDLSVLVCLYIQHDSEDGYPPCFFPAKILEFFGSHNAGITDIEHYCIVGK